MTENLLVPESTAPTRRERVLDLLKGIVSHLTGIEKENVPVEDDFLRADLDSPLLLQAIQAIDEQMGVRVSLVELLEEITTLGALAAHIDRILPPDALPPPASPPAPAPAVAAVQTPAAAPAAVDVAPRAVAAPPAFYPALPAGAARSGDESALERVIAQQLQLMSQQIAAIRGDAAPVLAAAPSAAPTSVAPPAAATAADSATSAPAAAPSTNGARAAVRQSPRARIQPATFVPRQAVNGGGRDGMRDGEKEYLDSFIARYVERTGASRAHQARYPLPPGGSGAAAHSRHAWKEILYPIVGQRARGSKVWDLDGNEYVDTGMAFGCSLFGHAPDFVSRAIAEQMERGYGAGPRSPDAGRAAELVCELGGNQRAVFCDSETEAVIGAIRAAQAFTGRTRIACFAGSGHGWLPGGPPLPPGDVLMLESDQPESLEILAREMDDLALVMVEPVPGRRPDVEPTAFLRELRRMTREAGVLLHFDERITGFRLGAGGAQSCFGVQADLVTYGKIVAGGLPVGVVAGTEKAMRVFDGEAWSHGGDPHSAGRRTLFAGTDFRHPLSMGVACAVLEEIRRRGPEMYERLEARTTALVRRMNAFFAAGGYPVEAVSGGSCFRVVFGPEVRFPGLFDHHLVLEGVHVIPETGTHFLSTAHDDDDVEKVYRAVCASMEAMRRGGLIPPPPGGGLDAGGSTAPRVEAFAATDGLPLTANGKRDRGALPAPGASEADGEAAAGPRTPVQEVLAGIWAQVLGREQVGVRENFFELGGHSLLATRVVSRIRSLYGVELPVRALFEGPTVAQVAERVDALRSAGRPGAVPLVPVARTDALPLSFGQERLWFLHRLQQGGTAYNLPRALRLSGGVDEAALERALGEIVRRHEPLRTTFRETDGVPVQVISPFRGFTLPVEDLSALGEAEREAEVRRRAAEDGSLPFDLVAGPLFRARLLRLGAAEHVLLLSVHHIVADGGSMQVLFRELWAAYEAFRGGGEPRLPAPAVQYADYAAWQRAQWGGEAEGRELAYWRERLAGVPEELELPTDHPRPAVPSFRGGVVPVELSLEVLQRLRELGRREGATLYMVVLAAFQLLLSRYSGSDDVVVGAPVDGRTRQEVEELVGLFMNTLVLRTDLSGNPSFRALVGAVRETVLGAYEHQEVPFERVVAEVQPERSLSRSTLFQVMFQLDDGAEPQAGSQGPRVRALGGERGTTQFDLTLALFPHARGISGGLRYSTDLFERGTARRMAEHLERLLEQAAADPDLPLSRLELMGRAERGRVLEWNRTTAKYPADRCIHQLFEARAKASPDAVAVVHGGVSLTFRELDGRANRLARHLVRRGVGPEVRVGICMERGPELLDAILGVMKAGGAWVPVDPAHPAERIAYMLEDSGCGVLLTQERLRGRIPPREGMEVVCVDAERERIAEERATAPRSGVASENLAYVIYTSGSTGRPKGVGMHHRGVCNYIHWAVRAYGAGEGNGAPVFTSMAVDLTITNLLPLFAGHPVRLLPEDSPVEALAKTLREAPGFGLIKITPIHLGLLNTMLRPGDLARSAHTLVVGADFLSAEPTVFWQDHAPGVRLMNEYGPTETVVGCSAYVLPPGRHRAGPVPVGRPIQNVTFHVLDARQEPVPVGLPGELYIGGAGVARGYLGRPGLTAEKFVPDPFAGPGARMYRSGDRARWLQDGNLRILGRADHQVKIRGYRVELGEVEAALRRHPEVRECIAVLREDRPGDRRLVAYVVAGPAAADPAALRESLRATLPEYMVPAAVVVLDALPQTPTGKLDRKALPAPEYGVAGTLLDQPRNAVEAELVQLWEELLGVRGIGATQSFFDLGGNSLLALRLFALVNRRMSCDLPVATLFTGATVRHMADAILEQTGSPAGACGPVVPLQAGGTLPPLFVVHSSTGG